MQWSFHPGLLQYNHVYQIDFVMQLCFAISQVSNFAHTRCDNGLQFVDNTNIWYASSNYDT
jgi:hypothetical protein